MGKHHVRPFSFLTIAGCLLAASHSPELASATKIIKPWFPDGDTAVPHCTFFNHENADGALRKTTPVDRWSFCFRTRESTSPIDLNCDDPSNQYFEHIARFAVHRRPSANKALRGLVQTNAMDRFETRYGHQIPSIRAAWLSETFCHILTPGIINQSDLISWLHILIHVGAWELKQPGTEPTVRLVYGLYSVALHPSVERVTQIFAVKLAQWIKYRINPEANSSNEIWLLLLNSEQLPKSSERKSVNQRMCPLDN